MFGLGVAFNDVPVYQQAQGFFAGGTNLFASQTSYDTHSFRSKKLLTQAVASTLGITNNVATTNPPGTVVLKDGTLGYGAHNTVRQSGDLSQAVWTKRGTATAAAGAARGNGVTMSLISVGAAGVNDIYAFTSNLAVATDARCEPVFYIEPVSTSGTLQISNVNNSGKGNWSINLALISGPTLINRYHAAVTVTNEWKSTDGTGAGSGPNIYAASGTLSVYIAAQISNGAVPLDYVPTTSAAVYGPRFTHDNTNSTYFGLYGVYPQAGLLREVARTNLALWCRDLTNAAWTKSSVTVAKTATGIDSVANSASTLTASGANGTVLQAITSGSAERITSAFVRRKTGTGTINMTQDNGTTWTVITPQPYWSQIPIPKATAANPTLGFRLVTSGDAIEVDYVQHEVGGFVTSPILTTTAAVTRSEELDNGPASLISAAGPQTTMIEFVPVTQTPAASALLLASTLPGAAAYQGTGGDCGAWDGTNAVTSGGSNKAVAGALNRLATRHSGAAMGIAFNGGAVVTGSFDGSMGAGGAVGIGHDGAGGNGFTGLITRIAIAPKVATDTQLQQLSAGLL